MSDSQRNTGQDIIIPKMLTRSLDLLPDPYCIRTPDGPVLYSNLAFAKLAGLRSTSEIIDRYDYEIPSCLFENGDTLEEWRVQDRNLVATRKPQVMLELHPQAVDMPYICRKVPFYDEENRCIGAFHSLKYLEVFTPNDFVKGKLPGSLLLNKPDDFFSEKECEIIFFRLQGMSCRDIASALFISVRTVENRLAAMYVKAGVSHQDDFKLFCEKINLHRYVPKRIMSYKKIGFKKDYEQDVDA